MYSFTRVLRLFISTAIVICILLFVCNFIMHGYFIIRETKEVQHPKYYNSTKLLVQFEKQREINIMDKIQITRRIIKIFIIYLLIFGVIIYPFYKPHETDYLKNNKVERFFGENTGQDRVALVEERYYSGITRINLIENAKESLDISYFSMKGKISPKIFLGCILDAANRGVKVRVLFDGKFHNLKKDLKDVKYAFYSHPNIELKFYEPFNLFTPWVWNNLLHDKFIIADNKIAMIGGRNIGDEYFAPENYDGVITEDRDVIILNTDNENFQTSAVYQIKQYFDYVWNHKFSKNPIKQLSNNKKIKGEEVTQHLNDYIANLKDTNPEIFNNNYDWYKISVPTNKVTLIHNPIERFNKEPWCWYEITNLMKASKKSIFIQSPYIIPTKLMQKNLDFKELLSKDICMLTNSIASTPNYLAYSGYLKFRKDIVDAGARVYEYQGAGSIHAKTYIIDDRISLVGSFNLDSRSAYLSTETLVVIDSEEFTKVLKDEIQNQIDKSLLVGKDYSYIKNSKVNEREVSIVKSSIIYVLHLITYFFDYLL